ncbi:response regulator transcription factor [bacterium]|nr:response regulator transcription factor [bacterium]
MRKKVMIVDDHPLVREGVVGLLSAQADLEVCAEASRVAEAIELAAAKNPDVAIIDLTLKDGNGIALIKVLKEQYPELKMLVLSMHDETLFAERALRAGAVGYLSKDKVSRTIVQAVRAVLAGKIYLSQRMTQHMMQRMVGGAAASSQSPIERLTDREIEIFQLIGQGWTTRRIATALELSPQTVETHREHIKEKLELNNTVELTTHAVQWVLENR